MQARFEINGEYFIDYENGTLVVQTGPGYFAYAICDDFGSKLGELKWFQVDQQHTISDILEALPLLQKNFAKKMIAFDFPAYTLLPVFLNEGDNEALLHLAGADQQDHILTEVIREKIALNYSVPYTLLNQCIHKIPGAAYWHLQAVRITELLQDQAASVIEVNIIDTHFFVVAAKNGQLLLAQHYTYQAPEDLLFYLLKIAEVHQLSQTEVQLNISGFIDSDSRLYRMLYDYFLNIRLMKAGWSDEQSLQYPAHYFTTLKQMAICGL